MSDPVREAIDSGDLSHAAYLLQAELDVTRRALCEAYATSTVLSVEIDGIVYTFTPVAKCWERAMSMWGGEVADGLYPNEGQR